MTQIENEQSFYAEIDSEMSSKPKHLDLAVSLKDLENRQIKLEQEVTAVLNTPPPKEEKKEEEAKEDETAAAGTENAEMKDEAATEEPEAEAKPDEAA